MSDTLATPPTRLTARRILVALLTGALSGGTLTVLLAIATAYFIPNTLIGAGTSASAVSGWLIIFALVILVWLLCLLIIGGPVWLLLHKTGFRSRFHAMLSGALLAGTAGFAIGTWAEGLNPAAWFLSLSLIGAFVGFLVRRIAYR